MQVGSVKGKRKYVKRKRKKEKGKRVFPFTISGSKQTMEKGKRVFPFMISGFPVQNKHALRQLILSESLVGNFMFVSVVFWFGWLLKSMFIWWNTICFPNIFANYLLKVCQDFIRGTCARKSCRFSHVLVVEKPDANSFSTTLSLWFCYIY